MNSEGTRPDNNRNNIHNHLINEKSPYLMQHAYNPVDWYPWGEAAFKRALAENKPILLSVGYSTCHWCHVMEKESFSDNAIAEIMNDNFICIKVDREERPDLDQIYINAVTALTGSAGWPLNVFLTPQLKPFFGGTYFPNKSRSGITGWPELLVKISMAWKDPDLYGKIIGSADVLTDVLKKNLSPGQESMTAAKTEQAHLDKAFEYYASIFDNRLGGFGNAPKFPSPSILKFLLAYFFYAKKAGKAKQSEHALKMTDFTLKAMGGGGIYDHVGGGFHRYSTDGKWHIPHFEKMLYDNAQLIIAYLEAYQITGDRYFAAVAKETTDYILRDMTHVRGGFYSAEDADSIQEDNDHTELKKDAEKIEGAFYVWTFKELEGLIGKENSPIFTYHFGVLPGGNAEHDPHGYFKGKNILYISHTIEETAEKFSLSTEKTVQVISESKQKLLSARIKRKRPHLDDKILTSWNGLMISACSKAYQVLADDEYLKAAETAADFIMSNLYDKKNERLFRRWRDGERNVPGMGSDYAFFVQGLIDLYESSFDLKWLRAAVSVSQEHIRLFFDAELSGFYMTGIDQDKNLILRAKDDSDSVIPSSGSIAVLNLLRLSKMTGREDFSEIAGKALDASLYGSSFHPASYPYMLSALCLLQTESMQTLIAGERYSEGTKEMLKILNATYHPGKTVVFADCTKDIKEIKEFLPDVSAAKMIDKKSTAYVCIGQSCREPITDPSELEKILK